MARKDTNIPVNNGYTPGQYNAQSGGVAERQSSDRKNWDRMLQQAAMVSKMNEKQALGYGVGRLLSTLWMEHLAKRKADKEAGYGQKDTKDALNTRKDLQAQNEGIAQQMQYFQQNGPSYRDSMAAAQAPTASNFVEQGLVSAHPDYTGAATQGLLGDGFVVGSGVPVDSPSLAFEVPTREVNLDFLTRRG
jgi:hypothetical protein